MTTDALNSKIEDLALNGPYLDEIEEVPEGEASPGSSTRRRAMGNRSPLSKKTASTPQLREGEELRFNVSAVELPESQVVLEAQEPSAEYDPTESG